MIRPSRSEGDIVVNFQVSLSEYFVAKRAAVAVTFQNLLAYPLPLPASYSRY